MAFASSTNSSASKNQFVAYLASKKTGKVISWVNLTDTFVKAVFTCKLAEVTAEDAEAVLPGLLNNEFVEVHITDTTAELVATSATDF